MATECVCECRDITDIKDKEKKTTWNACEHLETWRGFVRSNTELERAQEGSRAKEHKTKVGQVKGNGQLLQLITRTSTKSNLAFSEITAP